MLVIPRLNLIASQIKNEFFDRKINVDLKSSGYLPEFFATNNLL